MKENIDWSQLTIAQINTEEVSIEDLFDYLRLSYNWNIIRELSYRILLNQLFENRNIQVEDAELESFVENFRADRSLLTVKETESWLDENNMDTDDLYDLAEFEIKLDKLKKLQFDNDYVSSQFALNRADHQFIETYQIVVKSKEKASELEAQISEGANFFELARLHSEEESQKLCGYSGIQTRSSLRPELESILFSKQEGDIVGPIKSLGRFHLVYINRIYNEELNEEVKANIRNKHFEKWIRREIELADYEVFV